jgi:hypothetical protein
MPNTGGTSPGYGGGGSHHRSPFRRLIRQTRQAVPGDEGGRFRSPPYLSFDPAIEAERRAAQRSLEDIAQDTRIGARRTRQDFRTTRGDIRTDFRRFRGDTRRGERRELQQLGYQRADVAKEGRRGQRDFNLRLSALTRHFTQLQGQHLQQANAYGSLDSGTMAASNAARAQNYAIERRPIDIGKARLRQDTLTSFQRIATARHQTQADADRDVRRAREDKKHDVRLVKQDYRRTIKDLHIKLNRAIREQRIGDIDLIKQEIYAARRQPGGKSKFSKYGKKSKKDK